MRFHHLLAAPLLALLGLTSCDPAPNPPVTPAETGSVFVLNEGNFMRSNGSVSLFNKADKALTPDLFRSVNSRGLGDVVQDMAVRDNRGYIVVNNSNKVEVVSLPDFKSVGVVSGLRSPRYFLPISATRAYVTQWGNFSTVRAGVKVINLTTNTVIDSIATGSLPGKLLQVGNRVFVANSGSTTLTVIDATTNQVTATVTVGDAPNALALDKNGRLWVSCGGFVNFIPPAYTVVDYASTTPGSLVSLDPATAMRVSTRTFASNRYQPSDLHLNMAGDQLYFRGADGANVGPVFRLGIADAALPSLAAPFIRRAFYGLNVDPRTDVIYGGTGTFLGTDKMIRYQPNGTPLDSAAVGTGPNGFVFY